MKFLGWLNLLDVEGKLSITNLAMYVIILKVSLSPFDWASAVTLFIVCLNYMHKRTKYVPDESEDLKKFEQEVKSTTDQINDLKSTITGIALKVGMK